MKIKFTSSSKREKFIIKIKPYIFGQMEHLSETFKLTYTELIMHVIFQFHPEFLENLQYIPEETKLHFQLVEETSKWLNECLEQFDISDKGGLIKALLGINTV